MPSFGFLRPDRFTSASHCARDPSFETVHVIYLSTCAGVKLASRRMEAILEQVMVR
jgi:hypothetical protein